MALVRSPTHLTFRDPRVGPHRYGVTKWDDYLLDIESQIVDADQRAGERAGVMLGELEQQTRALGDVGERLTRIDDTLQWGFSLLADQLQSQSETLWAIATRLDEIASILRAPRMTAMRECYRWGQEQMLDGRLHRGGERERRQSPAPVS